MKKNTDIDEHNQDLDWILLARMAKRRKDTPLPDVDEEWNRFASRYIQEDQPAPVRPSHRYHLVVSALLGAAAMLLCVLVFDYLNDNYSLFSSRQQYVALQYVDAPQQVLLEEDHLQQPLRDVDSISYFTPQPRPQTVSSAPLVVAQHQPLPDVPKLQRLSTPRGMSFKVILSDSSEVWLNAESEIEFPATFIGRERLVRLKGEAYFKVAKNKDFPFIVESDRMKVQVLGTEFNFNAYETEPTAVSLVKGSVQVYESGNDSVSVCLVPGERASLDLQGEVQVDQADIYAVQQWVNGFFYFDNKPLIEILRTLGRWYNYGVIFNSTSHMHKRLHFSIERQESLEEALLSLQRFLGIRIQLKDNNIIVMD